MKNQRERLLLLTLALTLVLLCVVVPNTRATEEVVSISITGTKSYYQVGDSTQGSGQIQVVGKRADGSTITLTGDSGLTYSFSNTNALTVSPAGQITAAAAGGGTLTVTYGGASAKMYIGAYTVDAKLSNGEGDYPSVSDKVLKSSTARSGNYGIQLVNNGQWPYYAPCYDSSVSEIWFYDDGTSQDKFFAYFQSTGNDTTYTPRKDDPSTGQYFIGFDKSVSQTHYYYSNKTVKRLPESEQYYYTETPQATDIPRSAGWHQVTLVAEAGSAAYDTEGTVTVYLDGEPIFSENYTNRYMGVLRPQAQGTTGAVFDDLIWYTSGNNIAQTAPVATDLSIEGRLEEMFSVTARYTYQDANGDFEKPIAGTSTPSSPIEWQVSNNGTDGWTTLSSPSQDNASYTITPNEAGKYIRFVVTPTSSDQDYAVPNTARVGVPTPSQAYFVAGQQAWEKLDLGESDTYCERSGSLRLKVLATPQGSSGTVDIATLPYVNYQSSDTSVAVIGEDGMVYGVKAGAATITASVTNADQTIVSDSIMVVVAPRRMSCESFEGGAGYPDDWGTGRTGYHSLNPAAYTSYDYYALEYVPNGALEGWFYDDGSNEDMELYFQTGTRQDAILATGMYHVGIDTYTSTNRYYVKSNRLYRYSSTDQGITSYATDVSRTEGWHQVILTYQMGDSANADESGSVKIYLDGQEIFSETYSHDNMQVIRATVGGKSNAYFDDFSFYDLGLSGGETGEEYEDVEFFVKNNQTAKTVQYTMMYNAQAYEVYDLCAFTDARETGTGTIAGTGMNILENSVNGGVGTVRFTYHLSGSSDFFHTKSINVIRIKKIGVGEMNLQSQIETVS